VCFIRGWPHVKANKDVFEIQEWFQKGVSEQTI
jgi:hypothetical protein